MGWRETFQGPPTEPSRRDDRKKRKRKEKRTTVKGESVDRVHPVMGGKEIGGNYVASGVNNAGSKGILWGKKKILQLKTCGN